MQLVYDEWVASVARAVVLDDVRMAGRQVGMTVGNDLGVV